MKRFFIVLAAVAVLLGIAAPAALAAEPNANGGNVLIAIDRDVDIPAGDHVDTLVVVRGDAQVAGSVDALVVVDGTATLSAATAESVVVVNGTADLQAGSTVTGDVRTFSGSVTRAAGAVVGGTVRSFDTDLAAFALLLVPLFLVLLVGFGVAAIVVALLVAAFGARQVRTAESLISNETGTVLVAGIIGTFVLPILAILVTATIVGAPLGLGALLFVLPVLAFIGWIVAAIWVGDWILNRAPGPRAERPYAAAVVGVIILALLGIVPFVSAIATLFGYGALLVMAWRILRPPTQTATLGSANTSQPMPSAG
jgi:hypothetical protein